MSSDTARSEVTRPRVELRWWAGCPSTDRALSELREALNDLGMADIEVEMREIRSDAEAGEASFHGSPTVLIDGVDCVDASDEPTGLCCRVYRRRDGRIGPTPDPEDLRAALRLAAQRLERVG
ncbi:MAG TPA: hypothetical protein VGH45_05710 [Solirubrobacteraceae bacterium]